MPALGRSSSERGYLSIKEVLDILVEEFPDVTISKIRFLESRGLIHPERTPSGYRKFFEGDVDRLRWILRQQREHFLPLKVIKGRLDREHGGPVEASLFDNDDDGETPGETPGEPLRVGESWTGGSFTVDRHTQTITPPSLPRIVTDPAIAEPAAALPEGSVRTESGAVRSAEPVRPTVDLATVPVGDRGANDFADATRVPAHVDETASAAAPTAPRTAVPDVAVARSGSGVSFSATELAGASGAGPGLIADLEEFGLISSSVVGGVRMYGEEALVVARMGATFAQYGVEPRHLAVLKRAADRQGELFATAVGPLLRQRNPTAREHAEEQLDHLLELGSAFGSMFVKASVQRQVGL
jgi:DNA-binding transcriptional MerR regulator